MQHPISVDVHEEVVQHLQVHPDWINITPTRRHGNEVSRPRRSDDHSTLVQCLVVEPDTETLKDIAHLEFFHLDELPEIQRRHEVYSICIAKDVQEIVWVKNPEKPHMTTKLLYLGDYTMWTEPQVNAVILLMHAQLKPGGLKAGLRNDDGIKNAEKFADHYCRTVGVQRSDLPTLHCSGSPVRISRVETSAINMKDPERTYHGKGTAMTSTAGVIYRQDSQTPIKLKPTITLGHEHGGIEATVVVTPTGIRKCLSNRVDPDDIHCDDEEKRINEKKKVNRTKVKKETVQVSNIELSNKYVQSQVHEPVKVSGSKTSSVQHAAYVSMQTPAEDYWTNDTAMKASPIQV